MKSPGPGHGPSRTQQQLQRQMDLAAGYEAKRRRGEVPQTSGSGDLARNLLALIVGLAAIAAVVLVAWSSGVFG
jgi:hypothetical protein